MTIADQTTLQARAQTNADHVVHLVRDVFKPALPTLYSRHHGSDFASDNRLRMQGLSKRLPLIRPSMVTPWAKSETSKKHSQFLSLNLRHASTTPRCDLALEQHITHRS
jgi:hypothetical protein